MFATWARPTMMPMSAVVIEPAACDPRIDVHLGMVVGQDRGGDGREVDLCRIGRLEDLVPELQLDRAPEGSELAPWSAGSNEIVEGVEQRLFVERGERVPVA